MGKFQANRNWSAFLTSRGIVSAIVDEISCTSKAQLLSELHSFGKTSNRFRARPSSLLQLPANGWNISHTTCCCTSIALVKARG
jgi:hypothetical protein